MIKSKYVVPESTVDNRKSNSKMRTVDGRTISLRNHQ